jgi:hypothetical protein
MLHLQGFWLLTKVVGVSGATNRGGIFIVNRALGLNHLILEYVGMISGGVDDDLQLAA